MNHKIFLTSALAIGFVAPAMAETFPTDGYMQENKTYDKAATETNMDGVYEGSVNAVAEYDIIDYIVNAGQYLPADSETVITCPAGSYCSGIDGNVQYNQTTPQGIQTCPTGYASSAAGASSNTQCYRACDVNNMGTNGSIANIAHATAISGNDYYGSGTDTCEPTACEDGWHVNAGVPDLTATIGNIAGNSRAYIRNNGSFGEDGASHGQSYYGINGNNTWAVDYGNNGIVMGQGRCSTREGFMPWSNNTYNLINENIVNSLENEAGQEGANYCYCNVTGYIPSGESLQPVSSPWLFHDDSNGSVVDCASNCADLCSYNMRRTDGSDLAFRSALLGLVQSSPAMCEANVININWYNADAADISANNAGTATYGSDVRTPVKAQTIKGKTFRGWRFSKPEQVSTGN